MFALISFFALVIINRSGSNLFNYSLVGCPAHRVELFLCFHKPLDNVQYVSCFYKDFLHLSRFQFEI